MKNKTQSALLISVIIAATSFIGCAARVNSPEATTKGTQALLDTQASMDEQGCSFIEYSTPQDIPMDFICKDLEKKTIKSLKNLKVLLDQFISGANMALKANDLDDMERQSLQFKLNHVQNKTFDLTGKIVLAQINLNTKKIRDKKLKALNQGDKNLSSMDELIDQALLEEVTASITAAKDELKSAGCVYTNQPDQMFCFTPFKDIYYNTKASFNPFNENSNERKINRFNIYFEKASNATTAAKSIKDPKVKAKAFKALAKMPLTTDRTREIYQTLFEKQTKLQVKTLINKNLTEGASMVNTDGQAIRVTKETLLNKQFTIYENIVKPSLENPTSENKESMQARLRVIKIRAQKIKANIKMAEKNKIIITKEVRSTVELMDLLISDVLLSEPPIPGNR